MHQKRGTKCLQNYTRVSLMATQNSPHNVRRHHIVAAPQADQQHGARCTISQALSACLPSEDPLYTNLLRHEQPRGLRRQVDDREKLCRIQEHRRILANPVRGEVPVVHNSVGNYSPILAVAETAVYDGGGGSRASHQQQAQRRGEKASNRRREEEESVSAPCRKPLVLCGLQS